MRAGDGEGRRGKGLKRNSADFPVDAGDYVVVTDALEVRLTGKKSTDKEYISHSGFIGGLKRVPITRMRERHPEEVSWPHLTILFLPSLFSPARTQTPQTNNPQIIRKAVSGMLPKNTFRPRRMARLKVFTGAAPEVYLANVLTTWRDLQERDAAAASATGTATATPPAEMAPSPSGSSSQASSSS